MIITKRLRLLLAFCTLALVAALPATGLASKQSTATKPTRIPASGGAIVVAGKIHLDMVVSPFVLQDSGTVAGTPVGSGTTTQIYTLDPKSGLAETQIEIDTASGTVTATALSRYTTNNATICYNTLHRAWSGKWTGDFRASAFARYTNDPNNLLALATPDGRVLRWLEYIKDEQEVATDYQDSGSSIPTSITTREFTFGEPMSYKSLYNVEVQFYSSTAFVSVYVLDDLGSTITAFSNIDSSAASGGLGILVLPFILDANAILRNQKSRRRAKSLLGNTPKRGIQVVVESSSGKLSLQNATVSAFIDSFQPEEL